MLELPGYKIEKEIGKGGMARVYLALHEGLQRQVAIKVMSKHLDEDMGFSERFLREARIVANLNHSSIVTVYDVNVYDGYHYIAMEYLPGGITLDTKIKQGITPQEGLETIKHIAAALGYAHSKDIVHRDVKPENIMYREDGSAVLTDFGIARSTTAAATKMTVTGTVIGTPHYMSPEQAQGKELGPCSDIYSLGVVLYEVLTGKVPYEADSTVSVLLKHISEPVPTLEAELAIYQPVLNCMMAKDKESRYQNCDEIIADIDSLLAGGDASNATTVINQAAPATVVQPARAAGAVSKRANNKKKPLIAALAVFAVAAASGGYFVYEQNQAAKEQQRQTALNKQQEQQVLENKQLLEKKQAEEKAAALKAEQDETKRLAEQKKATKEKARQLAAQKKAEEEKAKQLAALELRKKEEARQTKLKAERDKARRAKQKKITDLFTKAESQLQNTQLKAAYQSYREIHKLEPGNSKAKSGINRVADRYLALARTAAIASDFDKANSHISSVIQIAPTHDRLASTQQEIINLKKSQLAAEEEAKRAQQQTDSPATESNQKKRRTYVGF